MFGFVMSVGHSAVSEAPRVPFFGFRGIVAKSESVYWVTVAAEMDMYPRYVSWVFVGPSVARANKVGKLRVGVGWSSDSNVCRCGCSDCRQS
jgi:hypothetical protein